MWPIRNRLDALLFRNFEYIFPLQAIVVIHLFIVADDWIVHHLFNHFGAIRCGIETKLPLHAINECDHELNENIIIISAP